MVASGLMPLSRLVEVMSINPRRILGLPSAYGLQEGDWADLTVLNTDAVTTVDPAKFISKGHATPYAGMTLQGAVAATIFSGRICTMH